MARMRDVVLNGGCLCERIRYAVHGPLLDSGYCHCTLCRRSSGAPAVAWGTVPTSALEVTQGAPKYFASSSRARRAFCETCGTQLFFEFTPAGKTLDFTLGSLDTPEAVRPQYHIWVADRLSWFSSPQAPEYQDRGPDHWD